MFISVSETTPLEGPKVSGRRTQPPSKVCQHFRRREGKERRREMKVKTLQGRSGAEKRKSNIHREGAAPKEKCQTSAGKEGRRNNKVKSPHCAY